MAEQSPQRKSYVKECLRLLYWVYFKPFTLERWLDERPPEPFSVGSWLSMPLLPQSQHLDDQARGLMTFVPLIIAPLIGLLYMVFSSQPFLWEKWAVFMLFWAIGVWLPSSLRRLLLMLVVGGVLSTIVIVSGFGLDKSDVSSLAIFIVLGSILSIGITRSSVAFGVAFGVAVGVAGGVAFGVAGGVAVGVAFGVAGGVAFGVAGGVAFGMAGGVAFGVAFGVVVGVAFGVAFILGVLRVYFWLFECLWGCILYVLSRRGNVARWLRYLPYYTDELIILPIPFMSALLVEGYQENCIFAQQTLHYLTTSTNQQRLAARAITHIAITVLKNCQKANEIAAMAGSLAWISSPTPKALGSFLPDLLDVSQGVRAAIESSSLARQAYLLNSPLGRLQRLRSGLAFRNTPWEAATFESILQRWLSILETARRVATEQAQHEGELPLAYVAGSALDPESAGDLFKGRSDLFREMETLVIAPQPPVLFLYGGRRAGKTSTLKYLPKRVGPEFLPLLIDMQGTASTTTLTGFVESLVKQILEAARQSRNTQLPAPEMETFKHEPFLALQAWFAQLERAMPEQRFLLCLDEFERLDEVIETTKSRAPLNFLRNLMQHHKRWIVLFSGSHTPDEMPLYWSDYLISVKTIKVGYLAKEEARDLIVHPSEHFPEIYDDQTVDFILQLTHCQPYLIQLVCSILVDHLNRAKRQQATLQDIQDVIPQVFDQGMMYFREFWRKSLTQEQRQALLLLLKGEQGKQEEQALRLLLQKEILEHVDGEYRFQIPLLRMYIEQRETVPSAIND